MLKGLKFKYKKNSRKSSARAECKDKKHARPCPEALGVDVFSTVRALGYPIDVLTDYDQQMNRYSFLLVE